MIGTLTAFQWLIYDSFKVYLGVSPFTLVPSLSTIVFRYVRSLIPNRMSLTNITASHDRRPLIEPQNPVTIHTDETIPREDLFPWRIPARFYSKMGRRFGFTVD